MSKDKITYEFVERDEENPLNDKLVKKGLTVEFQMFELDQYTEAALQQLDTLRGQLNYEDARVKNVEENHEDAIALVRDLDPIKQNAIRIYLDATNKIADLGPKRDKLEEAFEEHKAEIEEIKKQTGWEAPVIENQDEQDTTEEDTKKG